MFVWKYRLFPIINVGQYANVTCMDIDMDPMVTLCLQWLVCCMEQMETLANLDVGLLAGLLELMGCLLVVIVRKWERW